MEPWLEHFARANLARSSDTAHDLKTPLNVAVLNLELLRMRVRKLAGGEDDEKTLGYMKAIEGELRRMAQIFDTFFLLSTPPKHDGEIADVDIAPSIVEAAATAGYRIACDRGALRCHEARIRQALRMFFEGTSRVLAGRTARVEKSDTAVAIVVTGTLAESGIELTKIFKFYYTDPLGNPDLSLAAARLIAETYGGSVDCAEEDGTISLRMTLPLGE
jgi:hypothetical protein